MEIGSVMVRNERLTALPKINIFTNLQKFYEDADLRTDNTKLAFMLLFFQNYS